MEDGRWKMDDGHWIKDDGLWKTVSSESAFQLRHNFALLRCARQGYIVQRRRRRKMEDGRRRPPKLEGEGGWTMEDG
ncbi:MAG: hypothetical protein R3275_11445 [Saprospiraceae bacterium]|nr:hypothetical protein [Saprospiraceae bacterium]